MTNRGEFSKILPDFLNKTVDSEISRQRHRLLPGRRALTSKPFRYSAVREIVASQSRSARTCWVSNLIVQVEARSGHAVLPRETGAINECWISDRDRFSYEALNSSARLTAPRIQTGW